MKISGKNILITGASSGIGYQLAKHLAKEKCNLALLSRKIEILKKLSEELKVFGSNIIAVECDVTIKENVRKAVSSVKDYFKKIDIAILNSGVNSRKTTGSPENQFENTYRVNLFGVIYCAEELLIDFKRNREGMIVGVSSLSDARGFPVSGYYSSSKAAVSHYLEALRIQLKPYNIKVLTVKPGFVKTPITDKNEFYMPFLMDAAKAADIIIRGIKKEKSIIQFPLPTVLGSKLLKIMPNSLFDFLMSKRLPPKKNY